MEQLNPFLSPTELAWYRIAFPRLVLPIWLWSDETGLADKDTLGWAFEKGMLFICGQHWQKNPTEMERLLRGLCTKCTASAAPNLAKFQDRKLTWFLLKPCEACKQLKVVVRLFEMQRTHVLRWSLSESSY